MNRLVSIIIPVYNVEKFIRKCIQSIIEQTYKNLEIIIVDDGSKQNERYIIEEYLKIDPRIIYIKKDFNEGLLKARITGVERASGDFIMFVDADDYISFDYVRLLVDKAQETNSDIVFSRTVLCDEKGNKSLQVFQNAELYKLPLMGRDLKRAFYSQKGEAYIWHTVWNKIYKKELWDKCLPYFKELDEHVVMTEDIGFSTVLFYFAENAAVVNNAVYFYCKHKEASTNSTFITKDSFDKKIHDVTIIFNFIRHFFANKEEWIRKSIDEYQNHYACIWINIANSVDEEFREEAIKLSRNLLVAGLSCKSNEEDYFSCMEVPYNERYEDIKKEIFYGRETVVSFDVFDTAVVRPFYNPKDLYRLLDVKFEKISKCNLSFYDIRVQGEQGCREQLCNNDKEDVTQREIYNYISEYFMIEKSVVDEMYLYEQFLEEQMCMRRESIYELYELAILSGKKVVFTSDMYLSKECIKNILSKNGYKNFSDIFVSSEYDRLKSSGRLYDVMIQAMNVFPEQVIHIGDNIYSDVKIARDRGIKAIYFPSAIDAFCGKTQELKNKHRVNIGKIVAGSYKGDKGFEKNIAYGAAIALASVKYFDNPFVSFNDETTDFNVDAYLLGYYVLGMNIIGQVSWLNEVINGCNLEHVLFTSRDGYLLKKAYDIYCNISGKQNVGSYIYVSRRSMMPWILKDKSDFLNPPIVFQKYTPESLDELLEFAANDMDSDDWKKTVIENGFNYNSEFKTIRDYQKYVKLFIDYRYDIEKHDNSKNVISEYFGSISENDGVYDLGYSGLIHKAICDATKVKPKALFVHTDENKHVYTSRRGGFKIYTAMCGIPNISGLIRELFFSALEGSCVGYSRNDKSYVPMIEEEIRDYSDIAPIYMMQYGALQMVKDFYTIFESYIDYIDIASGDMMLPFEGMLCNPQKTDTRMFNDSWFEDKVYGRVEKINVRDFWNQLLIMRTGLKGSNISSSIDEILAKKKKKKLAIFGTGKMTEMIMLKEPNIEVSLFLDNSKAKNGTKFHNIDVLSPYECEDINSYYIVIAIGAYKEIEKQLTDMGLVKYRDFINYMEFF